MRVHTEQTGGETHPAHRTHTHTCAHTEAHTRSDTQAPARGSKRAIPQSPHLSMILSITRPTSFSEGSAIITPAPANSGPYRDPLPSA